MLGLGGWSAGQGWHKTVLPGSSLGHGLQLEETVPLACGIRPDFLCSGRLARWKFKHLMVPTCEHTSLHAHLCHPV